MKKSDLFFMSLGNLWRRKLRTILTLMGVVIGTASIIIMISLGVGMKNSINESLKELGSLNIITVSKRYNFDNRGNSNNKGNSNKKKALLNDETVEKIGKMDGVTVVSPVLSTSAVLKQGKYLTYVQITGVKRELLEKQNLKFEQGELFGKNDKNTFVFGGEVPYDFRNPKSQDYGGYDRYYGPRGDDIVRPTPNVDVFGKTILLNPDERYGMGEISFEDKKTIPRPIKIKVSGVLKGGNWRMDSNVFTSLETAEKIMKDYAKWQKKNQKNQNQDQNNHIGFPRRDLSILNDRKREYNEVQIYVEDIEKIPSVQNEIRAMGFEAYSMYETVKSVGSFADIAQMVLGGIGGVSLIVAAIGISNTMVMSIYERTKEIGVMKVIGASLQDIQGMFLTEAALIGLIGGIIGLVISTAGSMILNFLTKGVDIFGAGRVSGETPPLSIIPLWLYLLGMIFTTVVGLVSGYLPARRAMRLSVLKALRNE